MLHTAIMSLPCSVYSSFFTRFSPLSFQHDISPQCCLTQSGLLDNKCASCTAPSLHQLSLPSTSSTLPWLGCPGHSLPTVQRNDTRLDVFAATVISHPHLMPHAGCPCVIVLEKVVSQLDKKKKGLEDDGNLPSFLLPHLTSSEICW